MTQRRRPRGITVRGTGIVSAVPDVMGLTVGVSVHRDTVAGAREDAARLARSVSESLRANGIADRDIQTSQFGVHPEYRHTERRRLLDGYRVTSQVRVRIRELDGAGEIIDAVVAAGGNDVVIDGVSFVVEDDAAARREARALAWRDAAEKASELAALAGVALGTAVRITETATNLGPRPGPTARVAAVEAATPMEAGASDIAVTLEVRFAIEVD